VKQLFVLRHAKSSWDEPGMEDHDRPLAPRGRQATKVIAEHLKANGYHPELVLCSSARRTQETLEGVAPTGDRVLEPELYAAGAGTVLKRLHQIPDDTASTMVIGHNPAMQILVLRLARERPRAPSARSAASAASTQPDPLAEVQRKFPTGALAVLTFDCAWSELAPGSAELVSFVRPKALSR
jgi:phosphohistidine phosphatase